MPSPAVAPNEGANAARALVTLSRSECLRLLETAAVGRVGVAIGALPAVLPVNYALLDGAVVFRTAPGSKLTAALVGAVVAFEVDAVDSEHRTGWSVMVLGVCTEITDEDELARARELDLAPWGPMDDDHFVRLHATSVTGRALAAAAS